jgi:hypothetical protein
MTISVSLDYDQITFSSTSLAGFTANTMKLNYKKTCGTLSADIPLTSKIPTISNNSLTLAVTDIFPNDTVFPDGVYYFILTVTGTNSSTIVGTLTLRGCIYIGTTSRCKAVLKYNETQDEMIPLLIKALDFANDCDSCDCSKMCDIYNSLINKLTTSTSTSNSTTNVYSPCGCD